MHQFSVWEKESFFQPNDIIIIGAGVLGLWTAYELKKRKPHLKITILEKESFPIGASTRNAGFLCFGSPSELLYDTARMGQDNMLAVVEKRLRGIQKIRQHFTANEIDINECGGYEGFNEDFDDAKLDWLNQLIFPITQQKQTFTKVKDQSAIGVKNFTSLIANPAEVGIHSGKYVSSLIQKIIAAGVQILFGAAVNAAVNIGSGISVNTAYGHIMTEQLIFCTNGFTEQLTDAAISPARGQILLTSPIPGLPLNGTFHFDEGYYYWRNLNDRILIGGARNEDIIGEMTSKLETTEKITNALKSFIEKYIIIPTQLKIDYQWSGIMGFTETKEPLLVEKEPGIWVTCSCNGMGVALSPIFAEEIADKILQKV